MWRRWAHLRIPVSNLLINLKNNYLLKNCWSGPIKNVRILIFTMLHFFKEIKKKTCYFTLVYQKSWWYAHSFTEIGNYGSFFAFYPPLKTWKIRILKKKKNAGDIIILQMCIKNHNHMRYGSWDTEWGRLNFLLFWPIFCPFTHPNNPENQNFEIMKKSSGDVIILHLCIKNHNHMTYASWYMECDRHNFLSFWGIFCPSIPLLTPEIKIWKKCKKCLGILSFYTCVP